MGSPATRHKIADPAEITNACEEFLNDNYGLIMTTARRIIRSRFNEHEIMSEAAIAYGIWNKKTIYASRVMSTKKTSSYHWYLQKQLERYVKNGGTFQVIEDVNDGTRSRSAPALDSAFPIENFDTAVDRSSTVSDDESSGLDMEEQVLYRASLSSRAESQTNKPHTRKSEEALSEKPYGARYRICYESFEKTHLFPEETYTILKHLSEYNPNEKNGTNASFLSICRTLRSAAKKIRETILQHLYNTDYKLYIAHTLNGTRNQVLILAKNRRSAKKFSRPYGKLQQITSIEN